MDLFCIISGYMLTLNYRTSKCLTIRAIFGYIFTNKYMLTSETTVSKKKIILVHSHNINFIFI